MSQITKVNAREVLDSRGRPTVEVDVHCGDGFGRAIVPSGASTGQFEAVELRDGNPSRLNGFGVTQAVANVNETLGPAVIGVDAADQRAVDDKLLATDGSDHKSRLGANAVLGVSLGAAHAAANSANIPLAAHLRQVWQREIKTDSEFAMPVPMINMISGGLHAGGNLAFQDFLMIPVGAASFRQAMDWTVAIYWKLGALLRNAGHEGDLVGDEGGYGPKLKDEDEALTFIVDAIVACDLNPGSDVALGLDVAAAHFYRDGAYHVKDDVAIPATAMIERLAELADRFPIVSIEDGLIDDDWDGWVKLTEALGDKVQLIGDDLFVTNSKRLKQGIDRAAANSVLIKVNQIGTLSETLDTLRLANVHGYRPVISARSGETEDTTIADLAVATSAGQIKIGSVARGERLAKYNQLLRLEESLDARLWKGWQTPPVQGRA